MPDEGDQIDDDEFLHRRIPFKTGWYDSQKSPKPVQEAFKPHRENDPDGLSLSRAKSLRHPSFLDAESCAKLGLSPHGYYVALLRARDLRDHNIDIVASPRPDSDPGHVHLPQLKSGNRDSNEVKSLAKLLADELTIEVLGPFRSSSGQPSQRQEIAAAAKELDDSAPPASIPPCGPAPNAPKQLKQRTLTNLYNQRPTWLDLAHQKLDAAVFAAYGWPVSLSDDELLAKLLARNLDRFERLDQLTVWPSL